jgi:hypothetical protein
LDFNVPILVLNSCRPCEICAATDSVSAQGALESEP